MCAIGRGVQITRTDRAWPTLSEITHVERRTSNQSVAMVSILDESAWGMSHKKLYYPHQPCVWFKWLAKDNNYCTQQLLHISISFIYY